MEIYEWVIVMNKGGEIILTDNQYSFFDENRRQNSVGFEHFEFNPAFVVQAYRRPMEELNKMYPCPKCNGGKMYAKTVKGERKVIRCEVCKETGADLKLLGYEK